MLPETCYRTEPCKLFTRKSVVILLHFRTNHFVLNITAVKIFLCVYCTINNEEFMLFDVFLDTVKL